MTPRIRALVSLAVSIGATLVVAISFGVLLTLRILFPQQAHTPLLAGSLTVMAYGVWLSWRWVCLLTKQALLAHLTAEQAIDSAWAEGRAS